MLKCHSACFLHLLRIFSSRMTQRFDEGEVSNLCVTPFSVLSEECSAGKYAHKIGCMDVSRICTVT